MVSWCRKEVILIHTRTSKYTEPNFKSMVETLWGIKPILHIQTFMYTGDMTPDVIASVSLYSSLPRLGDLKEGLEINNRRIFY